MNILNNFPQVYINNVFGSNFLPCFEEKKIEEKKKKYIYIEGKTLCK